MHLCAYIFYSACRKAAERAFPLLFLCASVVGCTLVDQDLSSCETSYDIDYELRLVTNLTTELKTQVSTQVELTSVAEALLDHLGSVFTDHAYDVDLSFYDVQGDSARLHHESHIMDASEQSFTLFIPRREYMHLAVANLDKCGQLQMVDDERCHTAALLQKNGDYVESFRTGVFAARLPMDIKEGVDEHFDVKLGMVNCASALALDTLGSGLGGIKVSVSGFASGINLADSTYIFRSAPEVVADEVKTGDGRFACFCAVTFPSKDVETKVVIDTDDPFVSPEAAEALWTCTVYVTTGDGKVTKTDLGVKQPLRPGQFMLIRGKVEPDGSVVPREQFVGASVSLEWNEQPGWDIDI